MCPLLWKTTIEPSIPASDSIHFCPALALHPGIHLTGADHRLDSLAFFRALPQPFRTRTISDLSLMNWSHCKLNLNCRDPGWQRRPGRPNNDFLGEGFWRSLFLLRRTRSSHGCIMPAHGMFVSSFSLERCRSPLLERLRQRRANSESLKIRRWR